jgi:hypothetical protein
MQHVLLPMVSHTIQLSVGIHPEDLTARAHLPCSFPLNIVFRIYDNCLASGIEAMFAFGIVLLQANEDALLAYKFDEILSFLTHKLLDKYKVQS